MGEMRDRMLRGQLYIADDADLVADFARAQELLDRFNGTLHAEQGLRDAILRELIGELGDGVHVRRPFRCEYGTRISIGAGTRSRNRFNPSRSSEDTGSSNQTTPSSAKHSAKRSACLRE